MSITATDMDEKSLMRTDAIDRAQEFLGHTEIDEADVSRKIKEYFDKKYQPNWNCIVGKNFYSSFSYEEKTYIFFYIGQIAVLLYKNG